MHLVLLFETLVCPSHIQSMSIWTDSANVRMNVTDWRRLRSVVAKNFGSGAEFLIFRGQGAWVLVSVVVKWSLAAVYCVMLSALRCEKQIPQTSLHYSNMKSIIT